MMFATLIKNLHKALIRAIFTYLLLCQNIGLASNQNALNTPLSVTSIPLEFQDMAQDFLNEVSVYYNGDLVGDFRIEIIDGKLQFIEPQKLIDKIKGLANPSEMITRLSLPFDTNTTYACPDKKSGIPVCSSFKANKLSIVFNPDWFRVDLFIPAKYLRTLSHNNYLIKTPGLTFPSWLNNFLLTAAGKFKDIQTGSGTQTLFNTGSISSGDLALNYQLATTRVSNNGTSTINNNFNELAATYYLDRYQYQTGYLQTPGNYFVSNQRIFGVGISSNKNLLNQSYLYKYAQNLSLYLDNPSQVNIYKDDNLMSSDDYPAGLQQIDTSNLPYGSYQIKIVITDFLGATKEITQFFFKNTSLPPAQFPDLFIYTGYLSNTTTDNNYFPDYQNDSYVVNFGSNLKIGRHWGAKAAWLQVKDDIYLDFGLYAVYEKTYFEPSFMVSAQNDYGAALNITYQHNDFLSSNLFIRSLWAEKTTEQQAQVVDLFTTTNTQLNYSLSINYNQHNAVLSSTLDKTQGTPVDYTLSTSYNYPIYSTKALKVSLGFSSNYTKNNFSIATNITITFGSTHWATTASNRYNSASSTFSNELAVAYTTQESNNITNASLNYINEDSNNGLSAYLYQQSENILLRSNLNYSNTNEAIYNLTLSSAIAWSYPFSFGLGYIANTQPLPAGALISVTSSSGEDGEFEVYDYTRNIGKLNLNQAKLFPLEAFREHQISIRSISNSAYEFDADTKNNTVMPGNILNNHWQVIQYITASAILVNPDKEPITDAYLVINDNIYSSDSNGLIYFEYPNSSDQLIFTLSSGGKCSITNIPKAPSKTSYILNIGTIICYSSNSK
ncbi:TcfC E-set like domain-containing protein [Cysteiniphilum litorale]|nr:TcfC E-set like domain-containing protein [Cysteiniphilum litorale]